MGRISKAATTAALALSLALGGSLLAPVTALADDDMAALQQRVQEATKSYDDAQAHLDEVTQAAQDNQAQIDELEAQLPQLKADAATAVRSSYKIAQSSGSLLDLLLSADSFNDFVAAVNYLDIVQGKNNDAMASLVAKQAELSQRQDELSAQQSEAQQAASDAQSAMSDAIAAREAAEKAAKEQAEREAAEAQAAIEAAKKAEEEAKAKAEAEAKAKADEEAREESPSDDSSSSSRGSSTFTTESGNTAQVETPASPSTTTDDDSASDDRATFVAKWAPRINAYLAGSPMAGHGQTFAEAAWDNGVDPRWSPAIACIESSKGAICFRPHNAWGWGSSSWGDWDSAIRAHVAGLASGYGYTISVSAAKKYCPPNWQFWYSAVLAQMQRI